MVRDPRRGTLTSRGNMFLMYKIGSSDPSVHKTTLQHRGGAERRPRYKDGGRARPVGRAHAPPLGHALALRCHCHCTSCPRSAHVPSVTTSAMFSRTCRISSSKSLRLGYPMRMPHALHSSKL